MGVIVVVHDPRELPYVSEYGMALRMGDSVALRLQRTEINRLGYPWGRCMKSGDHLPFNYSDEPYSQLVSCGFPSTKSSNLCQITCYKWHFLKLKRRRKWYFCIFPLTTQTNLILSWWVVDFEVRNRVREILVWYIRKRVIWERDDANDTFASPLHRQKSTSTQWFVNFEVYVIE